jgi:DNA-binding CsgD family transcriptional regulator
MHVPPDHEGMKKPHGNLEALRPLAGVAASLSIVRLLLGAEAEIHELEIVAHSVIAALVLSSALVPRRRRHGERLNLARFHLTARELEFMRAFLDGKPMKEIAMDHGVSPSTVRNAFSSIYEKLGISGSAELYALGASCAIDWERSPGL